MNACMYECMYIHKNICIYVCINVPMYRGMFI